MSREDSEKLTGSLEALAHLEPFMAPAVRRTMELRLLRNLRAAVDEDDTQLPDFETLEERAAYILELLRDAMHKVEEIWQEFGIYRDPDIAIKELEEGEELRNMVESYLTLPDDDKDLLDQQDNEILQQKIHFADAVIEIWIRDHIDVLYRDAQEEKIRRILGGRAVRLTPLTKESINEWLDAGTPPDELFCEGHIAGVSVAEGMAAVTIGNHADGSGSVTGDILIWRSNAQTGEVIQEAKLEVIDPSEIQQ